MMEIVRVTLLALVKQNLCNFLDWKKWGSSEYFSCPHHSMKRCPARELTGPQPDRDAVCEVAFHSAFVDSCKNVVREGALPSVYTEIIDFALHFWPWPWWEQTQLVNKTQRWKCDRPQKPGSVNHLDLCVLVANCAQLCWFFLKSIFIFFILLTLIWWICVAAVHQMIHFYSVCKLFPIPDKVHWDYIVCIV